VSRVSDKIKEARIKKGLTQKQLAKKLGVAENFINEVESGRKIINESLMNRISKVLGKGINDIGISFEEEVSSEPKREISINKDNKIKDVWDNAFSSIIKDVPVYNYSLDRIIDNKQLPIIGNKVQGIHQDKVLFLKIEEEVNYLEKTYRKAHIARLNEGACTIDAGVIFLDLLTNIERISDHCKNISKMVLDFQ